LFPFFKTFGANISASVFSAQLVVLLIGALSTALIWQLIWRPRSFITSLAAGSLLFLMPIGVASYFSLPIHKWMMFSVSPGNSLRPLRAAAPYIVAIIYYFFIFHIGTARNKYIFSGLLTGSILLWSNDFAIPSAGLLAFFIFANALYRNEFQLRNVLVYSVATILSWATLLALATHGHPIELLQYNFLDVAQDQWWFFGPYGESTRIFNLQQLTRLFSQENYIPLFVLALIAILTLRTRLIEHALLLWIGAVLFAGGVVASVGGHLGGYFGGFYFWGMMATCVGFSRLVWLGFRKISDYKSQVTNHKSQVKSHKSQITNHKSQVKSQKSKVKIILALILLGASMLLMINALNNLRSGLSSAKNDPNRFYVSELGGYLGNEWKDYIDLAEQTKETGVFEEYWGLWSATQKTFPSWPVDSVIHALGGTRKTATKDLQGAGIIISTRNSTSPEWQPWNLSQNYWFYENLLKDWTLSALSPTTIVWRKSEHSRLFKDVDCTVGNNGSPSLILRAQNPGFYEIDMQYGFSGSGRFLAMIRNNISFGADAGGYISIDPKATRVKFPVYIEEAGAAKLDTKMIGNNDFNFDIKSCAAKFIPAIDGEVLRAPGIFDDSFFLTDDNWVHGIARRWAGFFVPNTPKYFNEYKVGKLVKFADGETREITRADPNGLYLEIYLNGDPIDPEKAGLLTKFVDRDKAKHNPDDSFFLTDNNWIHGIARRWAGFFVPNAQKFADEYKAGRLVKFANGETREIIRSDPSGLYLNIYLNGDPLNPEKVGLPTKFVVMDKAGYNPKEGKK
jgi:hypothetical protein